MFKLYNEWFSKKIVTQLQTYRHTDGLTYRQSDS